MKLCSKKSFWQRSRMLFSRVKFFPIILVCTVLASEYSVAAVTTRQAQYASIEYDVVYVRCPRGREPVISPRSGKELLNWNGANDLWLSATNNIHQQPGCDLVLHHSAADYLGGVPQGDPAREEVLVNCDENNTSVEICTIADPNVSIDGKSIVYTKFLDTRNYVSNTGISGVGGWGASRNHLQSTMLLDPTATNGKYASRIQSQVLHPYTAPALIFKYDLTSKSEVQVSPAPSFFAGRAYPGKSPEWTSNIPVMDMSPFFQPDGRIGFTSNRADGFWKFQLFNVDTDGKNLALIGHRALGSQLHPAMLKDGRIVYTSFDAMLGKVQNNNYSLFTVNPDGSNPFIFAGKHDPTSLTYHFVTQLSDGDIVTGLYYNHNNIGLGALLRFPVDPPGADFEHLGFTEDLWRAGTYLKPFARKGEVQLTADANPGDAPEKLYTSTAEYWLHPSRKASGRTITVAGVDYVVDKNVITNKGRFAHPSGAPGNNLLVTYAIGAGSQIDGPWEYASSVGDTLTRIGKDAGIWLIPLEVNSQQQIHHIVDSASIIVDSPDYHEIMARAVVPYKAIYGVREPKNLISTQNNGKSDLRLAEGEPYGLTGAASLFDRETRALNGLPWNMKDGGGTMSGRTYTNLATSGADLAVFQNSEIYGIRITLPISPHPNGTDGGVERWAGRQNHHLRILGEFPVRKQDGTLIDPQGNPDTSFIAKIPANTPFLMQTLDKRGMALDIETTSRTVNGGEQQLCSGCHVHTREGQNAFESLAKLDTAAAFADFTGKSAPLFTGLDGDGNPVVENANQVYNELSAPGVNNRRSFATDWVNGVRNVIDARCASCHGEGMSAQQMTGLRLDNTDQSYDLLSTNEYRREDGVLINHSFKPGDGLNDVISATPGADRITQRYSCCTVSRWLSLNSARSSMLVWALYGERLDGRDPTTGLAPTNSGVQSDSNGFDKGEIWPAVAEHAAYLADMPESEKRLIARWIDMGAPRINTHDDMIEPVLTITPVSNDAAINAILVGVWDDSALDYTKFRATYNGSLLMDGSSIQGEPDVIRVNLAEPITEQNADITEFTFEIWDKPIRSLSYVKPSMTAANRQRVVVTGRGLLRMIGQTPNAAPTSASAKIKAISGKAKDLIPSVNDPDVGDSHFFAIMTQPSNGIASVINNKLVYNSSVGYVGADTFTFEAKDLGGLAVTGVAEVTVIATLPEPTPAPGANTDTGAGTKNDSGTNNGTGSATDINSFTDVGLTPEVPLPPIDNGASSFETVDSSSDTKIVITEEGGVKGALGWVELFLAAMLFGVRLYCRIRRTRGWNQ